jgi:Concanavalin A-like lectin/glucanases superfamily
MYTVINGQDQTYNIPNDTLTFQGILGDPSPRADFEIWDNGSQLSFDTEQEVVIWDENAPSTKTVSQIVIPAPPSQNFLINPLWGFGAANWTDQSSGHITYPATNAVLTFANLAVNPYYIYQSTLKGYAHPGVSYMLSVYVTEVALSNGNAFLEIFFLDASGSGLASFVNTFTPTTSVVRYTISAVAPANTMFISAQIGGNATNATNSGTITFTSAQLEPMWFTAQGLTYPTPDCNTSQVSTYLLPDNTSSRYARLFAGIIDDIKVTYEGKTRKWTCTCAGSQMILDNGMLNGTFTAQYDDQIISSLVNTYFNGIIALTAANQSAPSPVVRGALLDLQNYTDNSMREALNGLTDSSGYMSYVDPYYRLFYNPAFYAVAPFALSDTPDNVLTFPYYDYTWEKDATQRKRKIKVIGGKSGSTPQVSQVLDQDASNTPLAPAYVIPAFDAKVNDTNLVSTVTTTTRGLAEASKFGSPNIIITCKAARYAPIGSIIYFTSALDGISNQPYVVQQVIGSCLGNSINEFAYTLGFYNPTLLDHIKNVNKALNRATVLTGVNNILAYDLSVRDPITYSEKLTTTAGVSKSAGTYGYLYKATVLVDEPTCYYRLDEASGTVATDSSAYGNTGTYSGSGVTYAQTGGITGDSDTAAKLDGTAGDIACPAGVNPAGLARLSVECWIKLTNITYSNNPTVVASAIPGTSHTGFAMTLDNTGAGIHFIVGNGAAAGDAHYVVALAAATWYHLVGTYDGTTVTLYFNGVSHATAALAGTVASAANNPIFGHNPAGSGDFVIATLDEAAIYVNRLLSSTRITAHYNQGTASPPAAATYGGSAYS